MTPPATFDTVLSDWFHRIRGEYMEIPGLIVTAAQARRLWGLDEVTTSLVLEALVDSRFLRKTRSGYARLDVR